MIDLRSDTVTQPTAAMREAMATAPVGDDVFGEDPTVNALEAHAAALFGKEAGLFVASGTMGNLIAVLTHCERGGEIIVGKQAHIFRYEGGGAASLGGVQPHTIEVERDGTMNLDAVRAAVRPVNVHFPTTRLICLENTHGGAWGAPVPAAYIGQVAAIARAHGLPLHIDGARIFNAAVALGTDVRTLTAEADTVSVCLSKGLCAPVGTVLVGPRAFIERARFVRKRVGGGMRQAGILAAAGLIALETMTLRLADDHANARRLADGLAAVPGIVLERDRVMTNMVFFSLAEDAPMTADTLADRLAAEYGIRIRPYSSADRSFRLVTHHDVSAADIERVLDAVRAVLGEPVSAAGAAR
jgi:threonine aldolase